MLYIISDGYNRGRTLDLLCFSLRTFLEET